jgi:hypothetical protein
MNPVQPPSGSPNQPGLAPQITRQIPKSRIEHQKQVIWQIWLPLGIGVLLILAFLVFTIVTSFSGGSIEVGTWRNVSIIFMILPTLFAGLVFVALFAGLVYGMARFLRVLPGFTQRGQELFQNISHQVKIFSNQIVNPVLSISSRWAGFQALWRRLF